MNKKAAIQGLFVAFGFLAAIAFFFYFLATAGKVGDFIGSAQLDLLAHAKDAERAQLYIEHSAELALTQAIYDTSKDSSNCEYHYGFSVWTNRTSECIPDKKTIERKLGNHLENSLNDYLAAYPRTPLLQNNYNFVISNQENLKIIGSAVSPLTIQFGASALPSCTGDTDYTKLTGDIANCMQYENIFIEYMNKNKLAGIDPLLIMALAQQESRCNPGINAGGIMQVDEECLLATKETIRKDPEQMSGWACPTVDVQIDHGTREFQVKYKKFEDMSPGDTMMLTLFAYNRGESIAEKAREYYEDGSTLKDAMYKACVEEYGPDATSKSAPGKRTWNEYFLSLKSSNPGKYSSYATSTEYYCVLTGPAYPVQVFAKYEKACKQAGGEITETGDSGGSYSIKPNFKAELKYSLNEYDDLRTELNDILIKVKDKKNGCIAKPEQDKITCVNDILSEQKKFKWLQNCLQEKARVFYELMEGLEVCEKEGICEIPKIKTTETYEIELTKEGNKMIAKLDEFEYEAKLGQMGIIKEDQKEINFNNLQNREQCDKLIFKISKDKLEVEGECKSSNKFEYDYDENIQIYIKAGTKYFFEPERVIDYGTITIEKPKSNMLKLCAQSTYRNYFYDPFDGVKARNIVYQIAAFAGDRINPDQVKNIEVTDTEKAEENATISFDDNSKNKDKDVSYYHIYYSNKTFAKLEDAELIKIMTDIDANIKTTLKVQDTTGYFAVTAVDSSGNENKTINIITAEIKDDLNPGPAKLSATKADGNIEFTIDQPILNEDGSRVKDMHQYFIYTFNPTEGKCPKPTTLTESIMSVVYESSKQTTTILDSGTEACYLVVPDDEITEAITAKRHDENSIKGPI